MKVLNYLKPLIALALFIIFFITGNALSHCQVPCGIYNDHARVDQMLEDATTVIKAGHMISELAGKTDAQSANQMSRWVMNKEKHAQNVISTISDYFLTQRVKASQNDYVQRLKDHHAVIVAAMKAKQNADVEFGKKLQRMIKALEKYYPGE